MIPHTCQSRTRVTSNVRRVACLVLERQKFDLCARLEGQTGPAGAGLDLQAPGSRGTGQTLHMTLKLPSRLTEVSCWKILNNTPVQGCSLPTLCHQYILTGRAMSSQQDTTQLSLLSAVKTRHRKQLHALCLTYLVEHIFGVLCGMTCLLYDGKILKTMDR